MGEEMESSDVKEEVTGDEAPSKTFRKRKRQLYQSILNLMEFYFSDANLRKDKFLSKIYRENGCVDLAIFLSFNKMRALTSSVTDIAKALRKSELIQVSEDGSKVFRTTPVQDKEDVDACTIYVEQLPPDAEHDWLIGIFSAYGPIDYVSIPKFKNTHKVKGFAFVEYRDAKSAAKALEAFGAKGCCLSPQMAPDQLISIKTYESEDKDDNTISQDSPEENENVTKDKKKDENEVENKNDIEHSSKKKRKHNANENDDSLKQEDQSESSVEKIKRKKLKHVENENDDVAEDTEIKQVDESSSTTEETENQKKSKFELNESHNGKQKAKSVDDSLHISVKKDEKENLKRKKAYSESAAMDETPTKKRRKLKSENDASDEEEIEASGEEKEDFQDSQDDENDLDGDKKKKRKRKKKHKKDKVNIAYIGLQILPKTEWKKLRNKYLTMQREKMKALKKHLAYSRWEYRNRQYGRMEEELKINETKEQTPNLSFTPGVIVKVKLEHPVLDVKASKSEARIHPEIKYVDVTEGSTDIYLRTSSTDVAQQVIGTKHWSYMELLKGEEEKCYWEKINQLKEKKIMKNYKSNQRGRDKLLKRAEKIHGKYIGFDER